MVKEKKKKNKHTYLESPHFQSHWWRLENHQPRSMTISLVLTFMGLASKISQLIFSSFTQVIIIRLFCVIHPLVDGMFIIIPQVVLNICTTLMAVDTIHYHAHQCMMALLACSRKVNKLTKKKKGYITFCLANSQTTHLLPVMVFICFRDEM